MGMMLHSAGELVGIRLYSVSELVRMMLHSAGELVRIRLYSVGELVEMMPHSAGELVGMMVLVSLWNKVVQCW